VTEFFKYVFKALQIVLNALSPGEEGECGWKELEPSLELLVRLCGDMKREINLYEPKFPRMGSNGNGICLFPGLKRKRWNNGWEEEWILEPSVVERSPKLCCVS